MGRPPKDKETAKEIIAKSKITGIDPVELARQVAEIAAELDNPPVNLDRASFVTGTVSFGSLCLDLLTGGGMPPGKVVDIIGEEGSAKSTACYHVAGNCMRESYPGAGDAVPVWFLDHEVGLDAKYVTSVGVKIRLADGTKNPLFNYHQPTTGESSYRLISRALDLLPDYTPTPKGRPRPSAVFIIDSIASMLEEAVEENDEQNVMASNAKLHGKGFKMIKAKLGRKNATLLVTNQLRLKPGVSYGNPEYEVGGQPLKYYPDLKIRFQAVGKPWTENGRQLRYITFRTIKNKQFVPFLECKETLAVAHGHGFDRANDSLGFLTLTNQVTTGAWNKINMPGTEWHDQSLRKEELLEICATNKFRAYLRSQIESGEAFAMYFASMNWEDMYTPDEEDAGTGAVSPELLEESQPELNA